MKSQFTFLTIAGPSEGIISEKGSKFIGYAIPIHNEDEFKNALKELKKQHSSARHFCTAFRLGTQQILERSNDDGEPSGTAGKPILNQLLSAGITEAGIIVVRYFGGTLLGTTGLIQAYKGAAKAALDNANIVEQEITLWTKVVIPYAVYNQFMSLVKKYDIKLEAFQSFENETHFNVSIPLRIADQWRDDLNKILEQ